jgi:hypothetical protein
LASRFIRAASTGNCAVKKTAVIPCVARTTSGSEALVAAYEELRREFLGSVHGHARGLGVVLLLERGMPDWMKACAPFVNAAVCTEPRLGQQPTLPASTRTEIVVLLAGMVLAVSGRTTSL